jgi:hypothetical protein
MIKRNRSRDRVRGSRQREREEKKDARERAKRTEEDVLIFSRCFHQHNKEDGVHSSLAQPPYSDPLVRVVDSVRLSGAPRGPAAETVDACRPM